MGIFTTSASSKNTRDAPVQKKNEAPKGLVLCWSLDIFRAAEARPA